ncbi:MAG: hypothetical protein ACF8PG_01555 [Maioricimonas sp. JB045]
MQKQTSLSGRKRTAILLAVTAAVVVTAVFTLPGMLARFHFWQLKRLSHQIESASDDGAAALRQELYPRHDQHRDWLTEHGYLYHGRFRLHPSRGNYKEHVKLVLAIRDRFPDVTDWALRHNQNVFEVWDDPSRQAEWEAFMAPYTARGDD